MKTKDIIQRASEGAKKMLMNDYAYLPEGVFAYITYYQIDSPLSTHDNELENVHSPLGANSPIKYRKINDVQLSGVDALQTLNDFVEKGFQSTISATGYFRPNTIIPYPGDYFTFDLEELKDHLFRVTDVQFSHPGESKFYQITYVLDPENVNVIESMISDEFTMVDDPALSNGTPDGGAIIKSTDLIVANHAQNLVDRLIKDYINDYYDDEMNAFVYKSEAENTYLWSGYLQHFLSTNHIINYYDKEILSDIYLLDVNRFDNPNIYSEDVYRGSIFKAIEVRRNVATFENSFMFRSEEPLRTRNLPFFMSKAPYQLLDMGKSCTDMWVSGFPFLLANETKTFASADKYHKFYAPEDLDDPAYEEHINGGDILYHMDKKTMMPLGVYYVDSLGSVGNAELKTMLDPTDHIIYEGSNALNEPVEVVKYFKDEEDAFLFTVIKAYINKELTLTEDDITKLEEYYYKYNLRNYILIPLVIYALQREIEKNGENK